MVVLGICRDLLSLWERVIFKRFWGRRRILRRPIAVLLAIVALLLLTSGCFALFNPQVSAESSPVAAIQDDCDFRALRVGASQNSEVKVSDYAPTLEICAREKSPESGRDSLDDHRRAALVAACRSGEPAN